MSFDFHQTPGQFDYCQTVTVLQMPRKQTKQNVEHVWEGLLQGFINDSSSFYVCFFFPWF